MKRKLVACISFIIMSGGLYAQLYDEITSWDNNDVFGKVRTVKESTYLIDNGGKNSKYTDQNIIIQEELIKNYDRAGVLMNQSLVSYVGGESKKWNFTYDMQMRLVEEAVYDDTGLTELVSYFYNGNKLVQKSWFKGNDKEHEKSWFYIYDNAGNLTSEYWTDEQGNVVWKSIYVYNSNGKIIEKTWYSGNRVTSKWTTQYDNNGKVIENAEFSNGLLQEVEQYVYNKDKISEVRILKNNTLNSKKEFAYNKAGNVRMEWRTDADGKQILRRNFDFDKAQRIISSFTWDSKSELMDKIYWTYDNYGNWVQRVEYNKHIPIMTVKRDIAYY